MKWVQRIGFEILGNVFAVDTPVDTGAIECGTFQVGDSALYVSEISRAVSQELERKRSLILAHAPTQYRRVPEAFLSFDSYLGIFAQTDISD